MDKILLSVEEFREYLGIGKTKAKEIINRPDCKFVVRIGRRVMVHKELLDAELKKNAKFQLKL
ncbi:excisionase [Lachnospiraceae bacterium HCP1S3_A8]